MTNRKAFMEFMREDLIRTRNYLFNIHEQGSPGEDPGAEIGPKYTIPPGWREIKPFGQPFKPGAVTDLRPNIKPIVGVEKPDGTIDDDGGITHNTVGIPVNEIPQWLEDWLRGNGQWPLGEGFEVVMLEITYPNGDTVKIYDVIGPDGQSRQRYVFMGYDMNGEMQVAAIPPGWTFHSFINGVPIFAVPGAPGFPSHLAHPGGLWIMYIADDNGVWPFPNAQYPVRQYADGSWRGDIDGDGNFNHGPWDPPQVDIPENEPEGGWGDWWDNLPDWAPAIIFAGLGILAGTLLYGWIEGGYEGSNNGGPPLPPGGDDSSEGGDGGDGGDDGNPGGP